MERKGYKEMLRDRCPTVINFALIWCKAKTAWINHVYENSIAIYKSKADRNEATRIILGISKKNRKGFEFEYTITWDNLTEEEEKIWKSVAKWVDWFSKSFLAIYDHYNFLRGRGSTEEEVKKYYFDAYVKSFDNTAEANRFVKYLIECCKKYA